MEITVAPGSDAGSTATNGAVVEKLSDDAAGTTPGPDNGKKLAALTFVSLTLIVSATAE